MFSSCKFFPLFGGTGMGLSVEFGAEDGGPRCFHEATEGFEQDS